MFTFKCPMIRYLCVSSVVLISYKTTRKVYTVYGLFILKLIKPNQTKRLYIKHESIQSNKIKKSSIELSKVYSGFSAISLYIPYIPHNTLYVCTVYARGIYKWFSERKSFVEDVHKIRYFNAIFAERNIFDNIPSCNVHKYEDVTKSQF